MVKLSRKIEQLMADLKALKASPPTTTMTTPLAIAQDFGEGGSGRPREKLHGGRSGNQGGPEKFDVFSFTSHPSIPSVVYDGYQLESDGTIVNATDAPNLAVGGTVARTMQLPDFEDLLRMP